MRYGKSIATKHSQRGITLVLISLIMLILIGMGAFAIDLNHQVLNKTRLQNAVDSAALASAVVADDTGNALLAKSAAVAALTSFAAASGNQELVYGEENISITFSNDLQTFVDADSFSLGSDSDIYIRVAVSDVSLTQYLSYIFGVGKDVSASAVAGPSAAATMSCNIAPMAVCGDKNSTDDAWGYNPNGYDPSVTRNPSTIHALKVGDQNNTAMGPGNFQLLDFNQGEFEEDEEDNNGNGNGNGNGNDGGGGGAAIVRQALAGGYNGCAAIGDTVITKPGNSVGPVAQGLNTRLNDFSGPIQNDGTVLPDVYVKEATLTKTNDVIETSDFYFADYVTCKDGGCDGTYPTNGVAERRILRIPIVDCTADSTGKTEFDVLGLGCFFLLQRVDNSGQADVYGQFLEECIIKNGSTGINPTNNGPYRIQLYKDPLSEAS
ncbi:pilus assembly protein TadG-related protein [Vibrio sp. PNB22_8_1]|uniref:pilus assembly protein TadG-related protein n=1 Tax=unclassified Vibrio TaxID=2614977 RepID=UPI00406A84E7